MSKRYTLLKKDGKARRGRFETPHGTIETPVFMNVGTLAAIKVTKCKETKKMATPKILIIYTDVKVSRLKSSQVITLQSV